MKPGGPVGVAVRPRHGGSRFRRGADGQDEDSGGVVELSPCEGFARSQPLAPNRQRATAGVADATAPTLPAVAMSDVFADLDPVILSRAPEQPDAWQDGPAGSPIYLLDIKLLEQLLATPLVQGHNQNSGRYAKAI